MEKPVETKYQYNNIEIVEVDGKKRVRRLRDGKLMLASKGDNRVYGNHKVRKWYTSFD